jgi:hypothetical protein
MQRGSFSHADLTFTRQVEALLDEVAKGKRTYLNVVKPYHDRLEAEIIAFVAAHPNVPMSSDGGNRGGGTPFPLSDKKKAFLKSYAERNKMKIAAGDLASVDASNVWWDKHHQVKAENLAKAEEIAASTGKAIPPAARTSASQLDRYLYLASKAA